MSMIHRLDEIESLSIEGGPLELEADNVRYHLQRSFKLK